jgi:leucyl-tRNA synthetase
MAEELWHRLGHTGSVAFATYPAAEEALLVDDSVELPVQINGKVRGRITVATSADEETVKAAALANAEVAKWIEGKPIKMCKVIKGKMVTLAI